MPPSFRQLLPIFAVAWVLLIAGSVLSVITALATRDYSQLVITALVLATFGAATVGLQQRERNRRRSLVAAGIGVALAAAWFLVATVELVQFLHGPGH